MSLLRSSLSLISLPVSTRSFSVVPTSLALLSSCHILLYISSTSSLFNHSHHPSHFLLGPSSGSSSVARGNDRRLRPLAWALSGTFRRCPDRVEDILLFRCETASQNRVMEAVTYLSIFWGFPVKNQSMYKLFYFMDFCLELVTAEIFDLLIKLTQYFTLTSFLQF